MCFFRYFLGGIGSLLLLWACQRTPETVCKILDFDHPQGERVLKLSDLLEDIQVVPLQTTPDNYIAGIDEAYVTNQYILINAQSRIFQFTSNGTFIRTFLEAGRGPNEIEGYIRRMAVDEKNQVLYVKDARMSGDIIRIDLVEGKILESYTPREALYDFYVDPQGSLIFTRGYKAFVTPPDEKPYEVMTWYNPEGVPTDSIKISKQHSDVNDRSYFLSHHAKDEVLIFRGNSNDTLFSYKSGEGGEPIAAYVLQCKDQRRRAMQAGKSINFKINTDNYMLWGIDNTFVIRQEAGATNLTSEFQGYFLYDKMAGALNKIDKIYLDPLDSYLEPTYFKSKDGVQRLYDDLTIFHHLSNSYGCIFFNAVTLKTYLQKRLADANLTSEIRARLEEVDKRFTENDNPVLLIGKYVAIF